MKFPSTFSFFFCFFFFFNPLFFYVSYLERDVFLFLLLPSSLHLRLRLQNFARCSVQYYTSTVHVRYGTDLIAQVISRILLLARPVSANFHGVTTTDTLPNIRFITATYKRVKTTQHMYFMRARKIHSGYSTFFFLYFRHVSNRNARIFINSPFIQ